MTTSPRSASRPPTGFTLIEIMIVVGVIGMLAALAIPNYRLLNLRAKKSERNLVMEAIANGMREYMAHKDYQLPGGTLTANWNPALPVTPMKKTMDWTQAGWKDLPLSSFGTVYYHYYAFASTTAVPPYFLLQAEGDLDNDGAINVRTQQFNLVGGTWSLITDTETGGAF